MNFIIYDIEATCWEGKMPSRVQETIEIGALFINQYGEIQDTFSRLIRPVIHPYLSAYCQELTHIDQSQVNRASRFPKVIEEFQDWAEIFDDDYMLCSWGDFDKTQLRKDCILHDIDDEWLDFHINLKKQYKSIKKLKKPRGLRKAVIVEGFEFTGEQHRAFTDAENLAKIFNAYLDEWQY